MLRRSPATGVRLLFLLCLLSQSTAKGVSSQCYDVRNDTICYFQPTNGKEMNWDDADKFCRDNNATLPVILHSDHQRTIEEYLSPFNKTNTVVLTAGRKSSSNDSQWRWVNGKKLRTPIGVNDEANVFGCIKFDVAIIHNGISSCSFYPGPFICQYPESVCKTLNNELFQLNGGSHCFVIYNYTLRWYYARNKCLEGGGDLANFDEVDSLMPFHNFTTVAKGLIEYVSYFIGLQKKWWTWRGRGSFDTRYTNWPNKGVQSYIPKDSPDKTCLCLDGTYDFKWLSCDCLKGKSVLCQSAMKIAEDLHQEHFEEKSITDPQIDKSLNASRCYNACGTRACYFTPENATRLDFASANRWCKNNNATLPIIRHKADQRSLESFLKTMPSYYLLWTEGIKVKPGDWRWINDQPFPGSTIEDVSIDSQTRSKETLEQKGRLLLRLNSDKEPDSKSVGYICQIPGLGDSCKALNKSIHSKNDECLVVNEEQVSWFKARNRCIDDGGDLATFEDVSVIKKLVPSLSPDKYYHIGLENSRWIWHQSDRYVQYNNWNESVRGYTIAESDLTCQSTKAHICARELENSRLCLCLETFTYKWTPCDCNYTYRFVCQRDELTKRCDSSSQQRKLDPENEMACNQVSIFAGVEGLIIALLVICIVSLTVRLRKKSNAAANAEIEMHLSTAKGCADLNKSTLSIPAEYQDMNGFTDVKTHSVQRVYQDLEIYEEVK